MELVGPLEIPAKLHLLPVVGTCYFLISPRGIPGFSRCLFTFPIILWPRLAQNKAVSMPPAPMARYVFLTAALGATSVCLNLRRTFSWG